MNFSGHRAEETSRLKIDNFIRRFDTEQGSNYKLKDFYIKTAYNCFSSGKFKNDYVDNCALTNCASYGVRALDMQIYSVKNQPVISFSALKSRCTIFDKKFLLFVSLP